jgi:ABC-type nitrate/sulfonate/bicarbonate transport system substrate-binding protein
MQAAWINDAEFAGYFIGIDNGYYAEEGLDLTYLSGGPDVIPESTIIAGRADLALTTPDTTIKAIAEQGAPFKIIGAQYQKNPIGIVSLVSNPINEPKDLIGKTLAVPPVNVISVNAMLALNGIDPANVNIVPYAYDPTPLIKGEIDASLDFTTNVPYTISQQGVEATSFLLYDFGFTIYNDTVVVTEETLSTKRAELVSWLRASRKGWDENFKDANLWPPKWANTWFAGTGRSIDNEIFFNNAQKPLMDSPAGYMSMTEEGIEANLRALSKVGIKGTRDMFDTTLLEEI